MEKDDIVVNTTAHERGHSLAEGWGLSLQHSFGSGDSSILFKGNGKTVKNMNVLIAKAAGKDTHGYSGDDGPAVEAELRWPSGVAVDKFGNFYIVDTDNHCIRKVDTAGIITTVAGNGTRGYSGDGGPATAAHLDGPNDLALDSKGNLYIADTRNDRIRRVDANGIITTFAGNFYSGDGGDNGPAIEAELDLPFGIAVDKNDNLYIADTHNHKIRKVDVNGIITTVAGSGSLGYGGDGGPAVAAYFNRPWDVTVDREGNLYIADFENSCIRKVDTSGIITTAAGNGTNGYSGDGGNAVDAQLYRPQSLAADSSGNIYLADTFNNRIRKIDSSGHIDTVAGNGLDNYGPDLGTAPATDTPVTFPVGVAVDSNGRIYIAENANSRIRIVDTQYRFPNASNTMDYFVADENGLGYILAFDGRHKETVDLETGVCLRRFEYDEENRLVSISDQFENTTRIERDQSGVPTAIVSPHGLMTRLDVDGANHLSRIILPDDAYYEFGYTEDGLMTEMVEPNGNRFDHDFDMTGRLTGIHDQEDGHWQFFRAYTGTGNIRNETLTAEGNLTSYEDNTLSTGAYNTWITDPSGALTFFSQSSDSLVATKTLDCGTHLEFKYSADPRYNTRFVERQTENLPSGLSRVTLIDRTYLDTDSDNIPDRISKTITLNDSTSVLKHDILLSRKTTTSAEGRTTAVEYDPETLLTSSVIVPGFFETSFGYDSKGRLISTSMNERETAFSYDVHGFVDSVIDSQGHVTSYEYDAVGRVVGVNRPDGATLSIAYDENGNMTAIVNPASVVHTFTSNRVNLPGSYTTPLSGTYSYIYDKDRRLSRVNFPSGRSIFNIYDKGNLVQTVTPEGNIDYTYLCGSKMETAVKRGETMAWGYDGSLVVSERITGTLDQELGFTYNAEFNLESFSYAGLVVPFVYDKDGLLTGSGAYTISRNADNGLPELVSGNGLNETRTFNGYGEIRSKEVTAGSTPVYSWDTARDRNGRIVSKTETVQGISAQFSYAYDEMGRLVSVSKNNIPVETYRYNANGVRIYEMNSARGITGRAFSYSDDDHLLEAGDASYEYNADGFLQTRAGVSGITSYSYSSLGELLWVELPDGRFIEYIHDPLGRRIAKKIDGQIVEKYLWQGRTRLLAVYDGNDNLLIRFEYADDRMPVAMTREGVRYLLACDQVGSPRVVADASGNVVKQINYDSFGNVLNDTAPDFEIPFGFAGGLYDRDTGLIRFGYRDYDPDTGRWTAKDPLFLMVVILIFMDIVWMIRLI